MRPYYEDDQIQIVQFKGPTDLDDIRDALNEYLGKDANFSQPRFMLELQYASLSFNMDEASEFFLMVEPGLEKLKGRKVVIVINKEQGARPPTARLVEKLSASGAGEKSVMFVDDLGAAHDAFNSMDTQAS